MHFINTLLPMALAASLPLVNAAPSAKVSRADDFHPGDYQKKFVTCNAVERVGDVETPTKLKLAYIDINPTASKTLIMVHGFPSLWTTYRHQIQHFGNEYRLIIPENRGFGDSQHPVDLNSSNTMPDVVLDTLCIMDDAGVESGICVGNDFGAQVCWEAGRMRPDRFIGVFNVGTPYVSAAAGFSTNEQLVQLVPSFGYQLYLSRNATVAADELNADVRQSIRSCAQTADSKVPSDFLHPVDTFLGPWEEFEQENGLTEIPASGIMNQEVEDYMVESYQKQGFYNTFNGYQYGNRNLTYQFEIKQGNFTLPQPTFTLFMTKDPVADWQALATKLQSYRFLTNYKNATIETSHWPHEEKPDEFNSVLANFLTTVEFP